MNMLRTSLLALLFIALVTPSLSLKCYTCRDCDNNTPTETDCSSVSIIGTPICQKSVTKDATGEMCSLKSVCEGSSKANSDALMTYCCDTDLCNGTPAPLAGLGLLLVPALAYFAA